MATRKRYDMPGMDNCKIALNYLRIPVSVEFKNGNIANKVNASYTTDNKFIQDAIEDDRRFKTGTIRLVQTVVIPDAEPAPKKEPERPAPAPVSPAPAPANEKGAAGKGRGAKQQDNEDITPVEPVESVKAVADAIAFFTEKGESISSDEELEALKEKYKVSFPNLK